MAKLSRIAPEIPVSDLRASIDYYEQKLGSGFPSKCPMEITRLWNVMTLRFTCSRMANGVIRLSACISSRKTSMNSMPSYGSGALTRCRKLCRNVIPRFREHGDLFAPVLRGRPAPGIGVETIGLIVFCQHALFLFFATPDAARECQKADRLPTDEESPVKWIRISAACRIAEVPNKSRYDQCSANENQYPSHSRHVNGYAIVLAPQQN
jgi:hypothetical protein